MSCFSRALAPGQRPLEETWGRYFEEKQNQRSWQTKGWIGHGSSIHSSCSSRRGGERRGTSRGSWGALAGRCLGQRALVGWCGELLQVGPLSRLLGACLSFLICHLMKCLPSQPKCSHLFRMLPLRQYAVFFKRNAPACRIPRFLSEPADSVQSKHFLDKIRTFH